MKNPSFKEELELDIQGMKCTSCTLTIRKAMEEAGAENTFVDFAGGYASCRIRSAEQAEKIIHSIRKSGYVAKKRIRSSDITPAKEDNILLYWLILNLPFFGLFMAGMLDERFSVPHEYQIFFTLPAFCTAVFVFVPPALGSLRFLRPNMDVLISLGVLASLGTIYTVTLLEHFIYKKPLMHALLRHSYADTGVSIVTFMLLGKWLEKKSLGKVLEKAKILKSEDVKNQNVLVANPEKPDEFFSKTLSDLKEGDVVLLRDGERIPADGLVEEGSGEMDESAISGESVPVLKEKGKKVFGGTYLISGNLKIRTVKEPSKSYLYEIQQWIDEARRTKSPVEETADRVAAWFVPLVVLLGILTFIWLRLQGSDSTTALQRMIAVWVISCPCAVGLAAPVANALALAVALRQKILFKKTSAFQALYETTAFAFDKTGTLTTGTFRIETWKNLSPLPDRELLKLVMAAESYSLHPVAKSMVEWLKEKKISPGMVLHVSESKGKGVSFQSIQHPGITFFIGKTIQAQEQQQMELVLMAGNEKWASFSLSDSIRPDTHELIEYLIHNRKVIYILSGDRRERCLRVSRKLGIKDPYVLSDLLPEEKLKVIRELSEKQKVCMVGDGINDALALAAAGTSVSLHREWKISSDVSDVLIYDTELPMKKLKKSLEISRKLIGIIHQNFAWAVLYNLITIPLAITGVISPVWAALSMAFSDLVVVGNSLRILRS